MTARTLKPAIVTADRILSMLQAMEPDDVAAELGMKWSDVEAILDRAGALPSSRWAGMCLKTGRIICSYTERGVYLRAQILGWTEWCFVDPAKPFRDAAQ